MSGHLLPREIFVQKGLLIGTLMKSEYFQHVYFAGGDEQAIRAVLNGFVDAAGISQYGYLLLRPRERDKVTTIARSIESPAHLLMARKDLDVAVAEFAARVGRQPSMVKVKDTRAQWGSCSPSGVLSFSWRLVLAPPFVLRYVAAHEVAHLVELNHSAAFWRLNAELDPNHQSARAWLKRHGRMLHAVGAE